MFAIQHIHNGQLVDYCEIKSQATWFLQQQGLFELIDTSASSKIEVVYTELGGPNGYGHQESSFVTYGGINRCLINLCIWIKETMRVFGPDYRDIRDFFKNCTLYVNGRQSDWLSTYVTNKLNRNIIVV